MKIDTQGSEYLVLDGANDRFKIQKIEGERRGAKRPTVRTQIPFAPSSSTDVFNLINTLSENMKERNIGLGDAYQLLNNAPIEKRSNAIDWDEIKKLASGHNSAARLPE